MESRLGQESRQKELKDILRWGKGPGHMWGKFLQRVAGRLKCSRKTVTDAPSIPVRWFPNIQQVKFSKLVIGL